MINFKRSNKVFLDFDGVIVDSNHFKEMAIEKTIFKLLGKNKETIEAINFFNINAGISRENKLTRFFQDHTVSKIMELYAYECSIFFKKAFPTNGLIEFLRFTKSNHKNLKLFVLSGGEKDEITFFLKKHSLLNYFEEILASEKNKLHHLKEKQVSVNDIFIGDSINDLKASIEIGIKFILFSQYKSLKSFPKSELIKKNVLLETRNFESLMKNIISYE